ncbi:MAG: tRNA pseudouridine(38-40) synthase TruA, partial [Gammaproteobacteria bacterium]|nr:tRNA pseudouridine(38-40) synthase TruA [Gammaproteobacteria bacterium]
NNFLPKDVCVNGVFSVSDNFDARRTATARRYRYLILNDKRPTSLWRDRCLWVRDELDILAMKEAANMLIGEHDFSAFRSSHCQAKSPRRRISGIELDHRHHWLSISIESNAFLHNMVRIIVGTLLDIGRGKIDANQMKAILSSGDRKCAGITAAPVGLYLVGVRYPEVHKIPYQCGDWLVIQ